MCARPPEGCARPPEGCARGPQKDAREAPRRMHSPVGIFLHHLECLKGLEHLAGHVLGAYAEVGGAHAVPLATPVDLGHGAHAGTSTQVQVTHCGG